MPIWTFNQDGWIRLDDPFYSAVAPIMLYIHTRRICFFTRNNQRKGLGQRVSSNIADCSIISQHQSQLEPTVCHAKLTDGSVFTTKCRDGLHPQAVPFLLRYR